MGLISRLEVPGVEELWTIGYRLTDNHVDEWTRRFSGFKYQYAGAVEAGVRTLRSAISSLPFPWVRRGVVVGAISAVDEGLKLGSPVARLGTAVAEAQSWEWRPDLLSKRRHEKLALQRAASDRDTQVAGAYECEPVGGTPGTVIIVDDFCTRGATTADISRAVREANPGWRVIGVVLGKNESQGWGASNDDVPPRLADIWDGVA